MKLFGYLLLIFSVLIISNCKNQSDKRKASNVFIEFKEDGYKFTEYQKQQIHEIVFRSENEVRTLLPRLRDSIKIAVEIVDWNLEEVGGVTGRAETNSPPYIAIQISDKFQGGISKAVNTALRQVVFHELHHLYRGWAIKDNKFEREISIATINEGLAVVFSEQHSGVSFKSNNPPSETIARDWIQEIIELPKDADYQKWMMEHPDGRKAIGYKTGKFLVEKAISNSGKGIIELSEYTPEEILTFAGY